MERVKLKAQVRSEKGKEAAIKIRNSDKIPAVVYGKDSENIPLVVRVEDFKPILKHGSLENTLIQLEISGGSKNEDAPVLVKEIQRDCLTSSILHLDFHRVSMTEKSEMTVPIHFEGNSIGVREGGLLEKFSRDVEIRCLPDQIPEFISVNIENLEIGHSLHISDIQVPDGVEIISEPTNALISVQKPREEEVAPVEEDVEAVTAEADTAEKGTADAEKKDE